MSRNSSVTRAQFAGQRRSDLGDIGAVVLADDRAHGVDMLIDDLQRDLGEVGAVLKQPAQAFGRSHHLRVAERAGDRLSSRGPRRNRLSCRVLVDRPIVPNPATGGIQALTLVLHPVAEVAGRSRLSAASARATGSNSPGNAARTVLRSLAVSGVILSAIPA